MRRTATKIYNDQCFRCGGVGHWARDCPSSYDYDPIRLDAYGATTTIGYDQCFQCGGFGHWARDCPSSYVYDPVQLDAHGATTTIEYDQCLQCHGFGHWAMDCPNFMCQRCNRRAPGHYAYDCPQDRRLPLSDVQPNHRVRQPDQASQVVSKPSSPSVVGKMDPPLKPRGTASGKPRASKYKKLLKALEGVLQSVQKRSALLELKDERAQLTIDFLDLVLLQPSILPWLRKHTTIALSQLCKNSNLYPQCYVLKDVVIDAQEDGGAFSDVCRGHKGEQRLCLKFVRLYQKSDIDAMLKAYAKEAILWDQLDHPNIVPFYGIYYADEARKKVCLVSPWMNNGNIVKYLERSPDVPREPFIYDIALGLAYLQKYNIVHSDLKGLNILVNDLGRACITDFGLSFLRTDATLAYTIGASTIQGCSYRWAAPELVEEDHFRPTPESDIWAFGCVCFEIVTGLLPFHECPSDPQVLRRLSQGQLPSGADPEKILGGVNPGIRELMNCCWKKNPKDRTSCQEIVEELKSRGITREPVEGDQDNMVYRRRRFQEDMGKSTDMLMDLTKVQEIFNEL